MKEGEYRPQTNQPEQTQPLQGRAEGRRSFQGPTTVEGSEPPQRSGLPSTPQERPTLPLKSVLNRAVEPTRALYERNNWVFLPFSEAGQVSPSLPVLQTERPTHGNEIRQIEEEHKRESEQETEEFHKKHGEWPITLAHWQPSLPDDFFDVDDDIDDH